MTEEELLQILLANAPNPMGQGAQLPPWTDQGTWEDPNALRKQFPTAIGPGEGMIGTDTAEDVMRGGANMAVDVMPGIGDVKAVHEAIQDPSWATVGGVALGALPFFGDLGKAALRTGRDAKSLSKRVLGKKVYHGTPHTFEPEPGYPLGRFKRGKIGTGEGGGAYGVGEGGYHGENPNVSRTYQPGTAEMTPEVKAALEEYDYLGFDSPGQAWSSIHRHDDWMERWDMKPYTPKEEQALEVIQEGLTKRPGNMYESALYAADEEMLHWDKPLSEHTFFPTETTKVKAARYKAEGLKPTGKDELGAVMEANAGQTGEAFYHNLLSRHGGSQAEVSKWLESKGLKGIKFLDQGSRPGSLVLEAPRVSTHDWIVTKRGGGIVAKGSKENMQRFISDYGEKGTSNYVVFNPDDLEILRILGLTGAVMGAGTVLAPDDEEVPNAL